MRHLKFVTVLLRTSLIIRTMIIRLDVLQESLSLSTGPVIGSGISSNSAKSRRVDVAKVASVPAYVRVDTMI